METDFIAAVTFHFGPLETTITKGTKVFFDGSTVKINGAVYQNTPNMSLAVRQKWIVPESEAAEVGKEDTSSPSRPVVQDEQEVEKQPLFAHSAVKQRVEEKPTRRVFEVVREDHDVLESAPQKFPIVQSEGDDGAPMVRTNEDGERTIPIKTSKFAAAVGSEATKATIDVSKVRPESVEASQKPIEGIRGLEAKTSRRQEAIMNTDAFVEGSSETIKGLEAKVGKDGGDGLLDFMQDAKPVGKVGK